MAPLHFDCTLQPCPTVQDTVFGKGTQSGALRPCPLGGLLSAPINQISANFANPLSCRPQPLPPLIHNYQQLVSWALHFSELACFLLQTLSFSPPQLEFVFCIFLINLLEFPAGATSRPLSRTALKNCTPIMGRSLDRA